MSDRILWPVSNIPTLMITGLFTLCFQDSKQCHHRSLACVHTHARVHARTQLTNTHPHTNTHAHTHARTRAPTHARTHARTHSCTHPLMHARTNARTHKRAYTHSRSRTPTTVAIMVVDGSVRPTMTKLTLPFRRRWIAGSCFIKINSSICEAVFAIVVGVFRV